MNQQGTGENGVPNGPPFPPFEPVRADEPAPIEFSRPLSDTPPDEPAPFFTAAEEDAIDEELEDFEDDFGPDEDDDDEDAAYFDAPEDAPWRSTPGTFVPPEKRRLPPDEEPRVNRFTRRATEEVKRRASGSVLRGFESFADRLDEVAERIDRLATEQLGGGSRERAADAAHVTAGWITEVSEYLRQGDVDVLRSDLERQVREKPLRSIIIAAGAGWLVGRILR